MLFEKGLFLISILAASSTANDGGKCMTGDGKEIKYPDFFNTTTRTFEFVDAEAQRLENHGSPLVSKLTQGMQTNYACMENRINELGGSMSLSSGYRPFDFQKHFYNINTLYKKMSQLSLSEETQPTCVDIYNIVKAERNTRHRFKAVNPPDKGAHVKGMAADIRWNLKSWRELSAGKIRSMSRDCLKGTHQWFCKTIYCEQAPALARIDNNGYCSGTGIVDLECQPIGDHPDYELSADNDFQSQITPWGSIPDPYWLYAPCEVNVLYQNNLLDFWATLKHQLSIDGIAEDCGLWRRYKANKKEWMHFECINEAECL
jgi:hypothetical protein